MIFIDTNFFLRFFLKDINDQYLEAKEVFARGAKGEDVLITSLVVVFEVFWVLNSYYHYSRDQVSKTIKNMLSMTFIQITERQLLVKALNLYDKTGLSLGDCYNLTFAKLEKVNNFSTFDSELLKKFESH